MIVIIKGSFLFQMMFLDDGYLYLFLGDGGSAGDPLNSAQNKYDLFQAFDF